MARKKCLKEILSGSLSFEELACLSNSYDIVGDIAIIRLTEGSERRLDRLAEAIMSVHRNIKTVLVQTSPVSGDYRIRRLEYVAGENRTTTTHVEAGCVFSVDVEKCYFSPRLSFERMRVAKQIEPGEVVVNMFAGVGCFSLIIARHSEASKVFSIDANPFAAQHMQENVRINGVYGKVIPILGDAKEVIETKLSGVANRVLMPLPEMAFQYLPYSLLALAKCGGIVHYYQFEHAKKGGDPVSKTKVNVAKKLGHGHVDHEFSLGRIVRTIGPNWYQVVLDIVVMR